MIVHGWSTSSVFNWSHAAEKWNSGDRCSSAIPLRPGALVWGCGASFWGIHNLFWIMCFSEKYRVVLLRLQGAGRGLWCAPRGLWSSFHKVYVFHESLPRTGLNSVCMVGMTALHWRTFALHLPSFSLMMMPSGGHSKNKEERGWLGRLRHLRALCAGKSCPITQDKTLKLKSVLPCPAWGSQARQCSLKNFKLDSTY